MKGTFGDRIDRLRHEVGSGHLTGTVEVNQVYAAYQHFRIELHHPRGGEAYYLQGPLFANAPRYVEKLADRALDRGGAGLRDAMIANVLDLSRQVELHAPVEFWDLRRSGHPVVMQDGEVRYDRAPIVPRLTAEQLKAKARLSRQLGRRRRS